MKKNAFPYRIHVKPSSFFLSVIGILLAFTSTGFAYDFSDARRTMQNDLAASNTTGLNRRVAIVYYIPDRDGVKSRTNLVKFKKDLSHELLKSFEVVDPVIVQEVIRTNRLNYHQIAGNSAVLRQFTNRTDASQVLFIELKAQESYLQTNMKLVNNRHEQISNIRIQLPFEAGNQKTYQTASPVSGGSKSKNSIFQSFKLDFSPKSFRPNQNDAWIYFSPTAEIIPKLQSVDALLWLKHLGEVDIRLVRLRYDIRLMDVLQIGVQTNAIVEKKDADIEEPNLSKEDGHHSTYVTAKYQVSDGSSIPVSLVFGIKRRILWDDDNTDFKNSDGDTNDKNDRYNQMTLMAAATGRLESMGLLYNFYVDSQSVGAGAKFLLTSDIKLFADTLIYIYKDPQITSDTAVGAQLYTQAGALTLSYQVSTRQTQMGLTFDF